MGQVDHATALGWFKNLYSVLLCLSSHLTVPNLNVMMLP